MIRLNCGSRKKLAAAGRVARRKGHVRKSQTREKIARGIHKGLMFGKKCRPKPESIKGIRIRGLRKQLRISEELEDVWENLREDFREGDCYTSSRIFCRVTKNQGLDIVEGPASSETAEDSTCSFSVRRAGNVGAPATLGNFAPTGWKRKKTLYDGDTPGRADTTRRKQRGNLEKKHSR
jgi:hypothetical protein